MALFGLASGIQESGEFDAEAMQSEIDTIFARYIQPVSGY